MSAQGEMSPIWILSALLAFVAIAIIWGWHRYRHSLGIEDLARMYPPQLVGALADTAGLDIIKTLNENSQSLSKKEIHSRTDFRDAKEMDSELDSLARAGAIVFDESQGRYRSLVDQDTVSLFQDALEKDYDFFSVAQFAGRGRLRGRLAPLMPPFGDPDRLEVLDILSENMQGMTYEEMEKASEARCPRCVPKLKALLRGRYIHYDGVRYYSLVTRDMVRYMKRSMKDMIPDSAPY